MKIMWIVLLTSPPILSGRGRLVVAFMFEKRLLVDPRPTKQRL